MTVISGQHHERVAALVGEVGIDARVEIRGQRLGLARPRECEQRVAKAISSSSGWLPPPQCVIARLPKVNAAMPQTPRHDVRAAVAGVRALETIAARAPEAEVVALESADLETVDFLVPSPDSRRGAPRPVAGLERLAVVQTLSAGTDWVEAAVPAQATLCSARGARDGPVAEWIVGALLGVSPGCWSLPTGASGSATWRSTTSSPGPC